MTEYSLLSAFLIGLLGGGHCVGMCGGIVSVLSMNKQQSSRISLLLGYNAGRIFSYFVAGLLAGGLGLVLASSQALFDAQRALYVIAAIVMLFMGLYLAGWSSFIRKLESGGVLIWKKLEPLSRRFIPVTTVAQAGAVGLVWGWIPCGLVYSVLIWSLSAGSALNGGFLMLAFGLGTLPNLLAMGLLASKVRHWFAKVWVRQLAGSIIVLFAIRMLYLAFYS